MRRQLVFLCLALVVYGLDVSCSLTLSCFDDCDCCAVCQSPPLQLADKPDRLVSLVTPDLPLLGPASPPAILLQNPVGSVFVEVEVKPRLSPATAGASVRGPPGSMAA
ncbi:MAG: hypothetical protein HY319_15860 [Armatimonadetes bacterium]|nr:hypothetical protein [Armatimonadota bacterium]